MSNKTNGLSIREKQAKWRNQISVALKQNAAIDSLASHVAGKKEMKMSQIRAAEILLKKVLPDLSATELTQDGTISLPTVINIIEQQARPNVIEHDTQQPEKVINDSNNK